MSTKTTIVIANGAHNLPLEVEATEDGVEIEFSIIPWEWIDQAREEVQFAKRLEAAKALAECEATPQDAAQENICVCKRPFLPIGGECCELCGKRVNWLDYEL